MSFILVGEKWVSKCAFAVVFGESWGGSDFCESESESAKKSEIRVYSAQF